MNEFREISEQLMGRSVHRIIVASTLPDPVFRYEGRELVSFSSNNYLALSASPRLVAAAKRGLETYGVANCESRLLGGDIEIYRNLEAKLARLKGKESAILFATGYLTNLGVLSVLPLLPKMARAYGYRPKKQTRYVYFTDECNHVSIREGIRMSGIDKAIYRHRDVNNLEEGLKASAADMKIIVTDGIFSVDGDIAPLPEILELADRYDALVYVDDAHATGILGATGRGTSEYFGLDSPRLISMGTLSKAYGSIGGFIATDQYLGDMLRIGCSAYGFTSPPPPDQILAVSEAMDIVTEEPERRQRLWDNQRYFVERMDALGYRLISRTTCIVPVHVGDEAVCEEVSTTLRDRGFHVDSIVFPGTGRGEARLRFNMNANHTREQIDRLLGIMAELRPRMPYPVPG